ncbi:4690_t:CDS:2, partial [Acaulospora colombiana]
ALGERWTPMQAFFVIMGGFYAYKREPGRRPGSEQPCYPLSGDTMLKLVRQGKVALPSEEEIDDRNKSDWFAKLLVLFQTTWFVAQCIARKKEGLPLTELEIVTLAYTVVNFGTSLAWWSKPRNVNRPIAIVSLRSAIAQKRETNRESDIVDEDPPSWDRAARLLLPGFDSDVDVESLRAVPIFYSGKLDWAQTKQATKSWALFNIATLLAANLVASFFGGDALCTCITLLEHISSTSQDKMLF